MNQHTGAADLHRSLRQRCETEEVSMLAKVNTATSGGISSSSFVLMQAAHVTHKLHIPPPAGADCVVLSPHQCQGRRTTANWSNLGKIV